MARFVLRGLVQRKILLVAACGLASLWLQTPIAMAQRHGPIGGAHGPIGGPHVPIGVRTAPPHVPVPMVGRPAISRPPRPRGIAGPRQLGVGAPFPLRQRPIHFFPRRFFFGAPFVGFGWGWGFNSFWCPNCCPYWGWGLYCNSLPFLGYGFENYVTLQPYEVPEYVYVPEEQDLVWLYLKDGTAYSVADYWFVNGQVHFIAVEEGGAKSAEHVIGIDELDLQTTIDVNTRRGFRVVRRDEPLEQYLRDHPDPNPPLLQPSPKS